MRWEINAMTKLPETLHEALGQVIQLYTGEGTAWAIAFTLKSEENSRCHWATNVSRDAGIQLFEGSAANMRIQKN